MGLRVRGFTLDCRSPVLGWAQGIGTVFGGGGLILALIGIVALLIFARGGGGCLSRFLGAFFLALGGLGAALAAEQFGFLDPTQLIGLFVLIGAAILGFLIPGIFSRGAADIPTGGPAGGDAPAA